MSLGFRLTSAAGFCLTAVPILGLRLAHLQIIRHGALESRASSEFARALDEAPPRGDILDRSNRTLARSVPAWSCFVDKAMVKDVDQFSARVARTLGMKDAEIADKVRKASRFAWLKTGLDTETADALKASRIDGIGIVSISERVYPNGDLGRSVLGLVGTEGHGMAGVEYSLDGKLRGNARKIALIRDGAGHTIYSSVLDSGSTPEPVRLTLDRNVQYILEETLRDAAVKMAFQSGYAAVEDPRSGEILAMAAWPPSPLKNPLAQDAYEPGSTFKLVTALSAIDDHLVQPDEKFFAENGRWEIAPGVLITDHEGSQDLTLAEILEKSSNIGIAKVVERVGPSRFHRMCETLGFGSKTGIPQPGETAGELKPVKELTQVGLASASYGYGQEVSPLQVLGAYSAIANGGILLQPKLLLDGKAPIKIRRVASVESIAEITRILESVVERGTGMPARINGYRIAGKTGTARRLDPATHRYSMSEYTASFVGFLPASAPRWTILIALNAPKGEYYGSQTAAPVFAQIARRLLAIESVPPDKLR